VSSPPRPRAILVIPAGGRSETPAATDSNTGARPASSTFTFASGRPWRIGAGLGSSASVMDEITRQAIRANGVNFMEAPQRIVPTSYRYGQNIRNQKDFAQRITASSRVCGQNRGKYRPDRAGSGAHAGRNQPNPAYHPT